LAVGKWAALSEWPARCARLGLPSPDATGGAIRLTVLGTVVELRVPDFQAVTVVTKNPLKPADHLLALHYLLSDLTVVPARDWITFREFPGGQFYWEPFLSRSIKPLVARMGGDIDLLREHLRRFSASVSPLPGGGLLATVQALGAIEMLLVYRPGDEEFPPSADVLYDACARRLLCAEDAAILTSRFCIGLL
jgi:hypothetical protein